MNILCQNNTVKTAVCNITAIGSIQCTDLNWSPGIHEYSVPTRRILMLTLLAPDIVEAILDGRQPEGMTLPRLMEGVWVAVTPCGSSFAPYLTTSSAP